MVRIIIALSGSAGSGKSTAATYLEKQYGFTRRAFATPLKQGVQAMFGLTDAQVYDPVLKETIDKEWGVTPRTLMQIVGTELIRNTLPRYLPTLNDVWIRSFWRSVETNDSISRLVIEDCRFPDEWESCKSKGKAYLLRILRHGSETIRAAPTPTLHASEHGLDLIHPDAVATNNNTVEEFYMQIDRFMATVGLKS